MADTKYINKVMTNNEKLISQFGYHWTHYMKWKYWLAHLIPIALATAVYFSLIEAGLYYFVLVGLFSFVIWALAEVGVWKIITSDVRIVTNKRIILKEGFFNRKTNEIKLSAIEAITFDQAFWERMLRVGCLHITGRGGGNKIKFHCVSHPVKIKNTIENINWKDIDDFSPETSA